MKQSGLLISLLSVVAASDCSVVIGLWRSMGKASDLSLDDQKSCCSGAIPGIVCDGSKVVEIDWRRKGLDGIIPPEIGSLLDLRNLYLGANQLTGELPTSIQNLKALKILDLGYNRLKSIPSAIGGLESLEKIVLWYNQISGAIPDTIGQLSNIQGLWLENNNFSGEVPASLSQIANITIADFKKNPGLTGAVKIPNAELDTSGTNIVVCNDASYDQRCEKNFPTARQVPENIGETDLPSDTKDSNLMAPSASISTIYNGTSTSGDESNSNSGSNNGYIVGGIVGATGLVATTLLVIFRTPKSVKAEVDDSPDLEGVTEDRLDDQGRNANDLVFETQQNTTEEAGPSAADIESVFPSIFSSIVVDLNKD